MNYIRGVDASSPCTDAASCLKDLGYEFVGRYYTSIPGDAKLLTRTEALALCSAGLSIVAVYEDGGTTFSPTVGTMNAKAAMRAAQSAGQPVDSTIYFSVDMDADAADVAHYIIPYFRALEPIVTEKYAVGVYGSGFVCKSLLNAGLATHAWLSMSVDWTGSKEFEHWSIRQLKTISVCGGELSVDTDAARRPHGAFVVQ